MPPLIGQARQNYLINVMTTIHHRGYIYDPGLRGYAPVHGNPPQNVNVPPAGTRMNCEGAALLMRDMALHLSPAGSFSPVHLRIVHVHAPNQMLFPWRANMTQALGGAAPPYVLNIGWIFDNHYRLRDANDGNRLYDPTFRTSSPNNYDAIAGSVPTMFGPQMIRTDLFGLRYLVVTNGIQRALFQLHQNAVPIQSVIDDGDFV